MIRPPYILAPIGLRHRWLVLATVGVGLANSLLTLLLPLCLGRFYEQVFGGVSNRSMALDKLGMGAIANTTWTDFFVLFGGLILLRGGAEYAENQLRGQLGETAVREIREQVFAHQLALSTATHRQKAVGKYLLRFSSDFGSIRRFLSKGLVGFARDVLFMMLATGVLLWLNAPLTALLLLSLLPFLLLFYWMNKQLGVHTAHRRNMRSVYLNHVITRLTAFETIKVFNRNTVENEQFGARSAGLTSASKQVINWQNGLQALLPVAIYTLLLILMVGVQSTIPNGLSRANGGILITFMLLVLSLRPVLRRLLRVGTIWQTGQISLHKLTEFLAQPAEAVPHRAELSVEQGHIAFHSVSFAYEPDKPLFTGLTFSIPGGTLVHLTGAPGTGKTTLLELLLRLYNPTGGSIQIDGKDLADCSPVSVRKQLTLASTEVPLLGRTVFEAVSYSRKANKRPRAQKLLDHLQTLADLPHHLTLNDPVGEQGRWLSTGQRSVLRLLRALLNRKPILLLDEPFEGLSESGMAQLLDWLRQPRQQPRTVLLISSRPLPFNVPTICLHEPVNPNRYVPLARL